MTYTKTAIYARGFELPEDLQVEACQAFAEQEGYLDPVVLREGYPVLPPAALPPRPALLALKAAVQAGEVGVLSCYSPNRLSRDPVELQFILSWAAGCGVKVRFVSAKPE